VGALLRSTAWLLDHPVEQGLRFMRPVLARHDDRDCRRPAWGIPRDGRITERAVTLPQESLRKIGALKTVIPYDHLVVHDFLPR
jgi:hypothetical protein